MLRSAQPSQLSTYPSQYIDTPVLAVLLYLQVCIRRQGMFLPSLCPVPVPTVGCRHLRPAGPGARPARRLRLALREGNGGECSGGRGLPVLPRAAPPLHLLAAGSLGMLALHPTGAQCHLPVSASPRRRLRGCADLCEEYQHSVRM